ncbi:hypothetical protein M902_2741 [Bacteriovorax sp. BAL6_X]|uniref:hypothetical protein n=1 Tax=Bacteriovorax sp. BAL6_X TaxID=1201290 RepID=UPI0003868E49|nr:hypothetical protein [Bacteriovorax sp. BAL6_X]EPZ51350.1 hypothetical protein M902_2741 [Bacteriovorax sp. BAL6_X]
MLLLDSNIVGNLDLYFNNINYSKEHDDRSLLVHDLLTFTAKSKWDFNYNFYLLESLLNNGPNDFIKSSLDSLININRVLMLNNDQFLESGSVTICDETFRFYCEKYNSNSVEEISLSILKQKLNSWPTAKSMGLAMKISYICLIEMFLIHKTSKKSVPKKMEEFLNFIDEKIRNKMGVEEILAIHYFFNKFNSFFKIELNSSFMKCSSNLKATSRDLYFIRMIEDFFGSSLPTVAKYCYICTFEHSIKELFDILKPSLIKVENNRVSLSIRNFDFKYLENEKNIDTVIDYYINKKRFGNRKPLTESEIELLVCESESRLKNILKS